MGCAGHATGDDPGFGDFRRIMVLSASSVTMISQGQSPFSQGVPQILFLVLGVVAMAVITNIPVGWYHKQVVVNTMLAVALVLQLAVVVIGVEVNGNRNWIELGPVQMRPSEFSKLAIVMWLAWVYNRQGDISRSLWRTLFPSIYGVGALILLIMVGGDMGTALVYGFIFPGHDVDGRCLTSVNLCRLAARLPRWPCWAF